MSEELKLRKLESEAWGFRLTGGRDFGTPLTVLRVTGASVAEESGMEVGDMIVSINGTCTAHMTHVEAQQHILGAGSSLTLQILRGSPVPAQELVTTPLRGMTPNIQRCESELTNDSHEPLKLAKSPLPHLHHFIDEEEQPPTEEDLTEQRIAEKMLENAELLEGNVIGVNFKRFIPKVDFIKNSLVYQVLQEEQVYKAKTEEEQLEKCPEKRFSTFLVHPHNAKPKAKKEVAKFPKRPQTPLLPEPVENQEKTEEKISVASSPQTKTEGKPEENSENPPKTNTEEKQKENQPVPAIEEPKAETNAASHIEILITDEETGETSEAKDREIKQIEIKSIEIIEESTEGQNSKGSLEISVAPLTKQEILNAQQELPAIEEVQEEIEEVTEDSEFNKQLGLIKNQLASLRQLPSLIETQLNLFQTQIDCLVELKHKESRTGSDEIHQKEKSEPSSRDIQNVSSEQIIAAQTENSEHPNIDLSVGQRVEDSENSPSVEVTKDQAQESQEKSYCQSQSGGDSQTKEDTQDGCESREQAHHATPTPPPKIRPKKSSLFNGITPQPRPVVLPGGRIWRKPQDAYNEDFIAETIISQAEVLIGSQTGVNFRKYESPKFSMSESAVWRLINHLENKSTEDDAAGDFYQTPIDEKKIFVAGLHMNPDVEAVVREVEESEALRNAPPVNNHHVEVSLGQEPVSSF